MSSYAGSGRPQQVTSREEEGLYHVRESSSSRRPAKGYTTTTSSRQELIPAGGRRGVGSDSEDSDNYEQWTTSKKKINHKTRQVETRVSRQLLVEDGRVIADSGPQVTTRIKEDNKVEECEREKAPKNRARFEALEAAPEGECLSGRVLGEKKEIQRVSREVREENMQYHDERFKELSGQDVHRRAIHAPHELITITDQQHSAAAPPRGRMVHYSNKGKKYQDTDEILEVAKLAIDGSITKEVKRTRHHEECSEDEKPDEHGEAEALREAPTVTRSSRRHVDYVNDFDDTSASSSDNQDEEPRRTSKTTSSQARSHNSKQQAAFPRYHIDPLLNSLNEDDFRSQPERRLEVRQGRAAMRRSSSSGSDLSEEARQRATVTARTSSHPVEAQPSRRPVEIPDEYRVAPRHHHKGPKSELSHRGSTLGSRKQRPTVAQWEDASVQAHLSEEEHEEAAAADSHRRAARKLERSARGSRRNYYYGKPHQHQQQAPGTPVRRPQSADSSRSSSSESSWLEKSGKGRDGAVSRDSGFKSPQTTDHSKPSRRPETPVQQPIYAVSSKARRQPPASPALSQRSVKTSTRTFAAGLEPERPERRIKHYAAPEDQASAPNRRTGGGGGGGGGQQDGGKGSRRNSLEDSVSLSSVRLSGHPATTIQVPYLREPHRQEPAAQNHFNYRTIVTNLQGPGTGPTATSAHLPRRPPVLDTYNVRVIEHNSPFRNKLAPVNSISELSNSIARLELLSECLSSPMQLAEVAGAKSATELQTLASNNDNDNNNSTAFNLNHFIKAPRTIVDHPSSSDSLLVDPDSVSLESAGSLRSSRTYHVRSAAQQVQESRGVEQPDSDREYLDDNSDEQRFDDEKYFPVETVVQPTKLQDDDEDAKKARAWIFDPTDGSSTRIVAPPKPEAPKPPKVDSKELGEARGGRAFYLQVVEPEEKEPVVENSKRSVAEQRQRWSSQGNLQKFAAPSSASSLSGRKSTSGLQLNKDQPRGLSKRSSSTTHQPARALSSRTKLLSATKSNIPMAAAESSSQAAFPVHEQLGRSKSSSCLTVSSIRPSKYSIYGGLRQSGDLKPVPRLSYSKAIGPKAHRQTAVQQAPLAPSRYLKMR